MRNEWRSNVWMSVELIVVGAVLFSIFSLFITMAYLHRPPKGIDFNDVYVGRMGWIKESSSSYKPYPDSLHNYFTDLEMLKANLRSNPYVESVGTGNNAIPYNYNYSGTMISLNDGDSTIYYRANRRLMDADMVRTLRLTGTKGESTEELAKIIEEGKFLISTIDCDDDFNAEKWIGHETYIGNDSANVFTIGGVVNGIRRVDYEPLYAGVLIYNNDNFPYEIAVRVKEGKGREFMESLNESYLEFGNMYISDVMSVEHRREEAHREFTTIIRNLSACAVFLMIAVFLGILGSFWYRTQQRIPEIALRKVNGATNRNILRRFLSEGLMLLLVSAPVIALIIAFFLPEFGIYEYVSTPKWLIWAMFPVAILALGVMIVAGIAFPAAKAMKINPAEALKDQ